MSTRTANRSPSRYRKLGAYAVLAIVLLAAAVSVGVAMRSRSRAIDAERLVWRPAQLAARELLTAVIDQETSQRSFVITGDQPYLEAYESGSIRAHGALDRLGELLVDRPETAAVLDAASRNLDAWETKAAEPRIAEALQAGPERPSLEVDEGVENQLLATFRSDHDSLVDAIDEGFRRSEQRRNRAFTVLLVTAVGGVVSLAAVVGALHRSQMWLAERDRLLRAEQELRDDNTTVSTTLGVTSARLDIEITKLRAVEQRVRTIAERLQASLLPTSIPEVEGLEFAVRYRPAGADMDVGGDFYDVVARTDGTVAVSIGDVCGHDIEAAVLTGLVRHVMSAAAHHLRDPAEVLRWANQAVLGNTDNDRFVSAAHGHFEAATPDHPTRLRLTLAGHPHPVFLAADGSPPREIGRSGTLLGLTDRPGFFTTVVELDPGDQIVLYTDGLIENPTRRRNAEDLLEVLDTVPRSSAEETAAHVLGIYDSWDLRSSLDDVAVLVVRRSPCLAAHAALGARREPTRVAAREPFRQPTREPFSESQGATR